jgi:hypothetical protein
MECYGKFCSVILKNTEKEHVFSTRCVILLNCFCFVNKIGMRWLEEVAQLMDECCYAQTLLLNHVGR